MANPQRSILIGYIIVFSALAIVLTLAGLRYLSPPSIFKVRLRRGSGYGSPSARRLHLRIINRSYPLDRFIFGKGLATALALGITLRVIVCSITDVTVLLFVAPPEYLKFAEYSLKAVGFNAASTSDVLALPLPLTGIFNILHALLSSIIAYALFRAATTMWRA